MVNSLKLEMLRNHTDALRAELVHVSAEGQTVITIGMTIPNQLGRISLLEMQAELLRMACADLEAARRDLLSMPGAST